MPCKTFALIERLWGEHWGDRSALIHVGCITFRITAILRVRKSERSSAEFSDTVECVNVETWLPVCEYENLYEVSSRCRVRSVDRIVAHRRGARHIRGRVLRPAVRA